jgi:hypothetical protein
MVIVSSPIGVDLDAVIAGTGTSSDESGAFHLGQRAVLDDNGEAMYVHASAAIAANDVVGIDENFEAAPLTKAMADDGWMIGVAADVALSDNDFGWVRMKGSNFSGNVLASCAADAALYTSGTAGSLDDSSSSQTAIKGVVCVTAGSGGGKTAVEFIVPNGMRSTTF